MEFIILDFGTPKKAATTLEFMAEQAVRMQPPLIEIVDDMFKVEAEIFASAGRRGGGSWKMLTAETAKRKGNWQILRGTQDESLFRSLTEPGAPFQILQISNSEIFFGTERPWASVHQEGSRDGRIPRRPFIRFLPTDITRWQRIIQRHLTKPFRRVENE
jgi:phage gpG-like protein